MGSVVDRSVKLLRGIKNGSIVVSDSIVDEINKQGLKFVEPCSSVKCGEMTESARTASIHLVISFPLFLVVLHSLFFNEVVMSKSPAGIFISFPPLFVLHSFCWVESCYNPL